MRQSVNIWRQRPYLVLSVLAAATGSRCRSEKAGFKPQPLKAAVKRKLNIDITTLKELRQIVAHVQMY